MLGFPLPYLDELLYSTIARHGVHSGITSPKELLSEVFGSTKIIATADLPGRINHIAALYPEKLGITPIDLLYRHTLFPLYSVFIGEKRRQYLLHQLSHSTKSTVHLAAGVAASRIHQPVYLRYCPGCIREQLAQYGECFWRRDWQVAGADSCPKHGQLLDSAIHRHNTHRHQFQAANPIDCPDVTQPTASWQSNLIAQSVKALLWLTPVPSPELAQWSQWYLDLAADHGFNRGGQVKHGLVADKVVGFWGKQWLSQYGLLPEENESNWIRSIFRKHRKAFSYLEHLVVLHALMPKGWYLPNIINDILKQRTEVKRLSLQLPVSDPTLLEEYRQKWLSAVIRHGTKQARLNGFGGIYTWLYRHDRHWLEEQNNLYRKPESVRANKVNWYQRDIAIVRQLIRLCNHYENQLTAPRLTANWYLNQLPRKAHIEKHLDRLPICRLFFDRYCENIFEYQIRRITRTVVVADMPLKRWQVLRLSGLSKERLTWPADRFLKEILGI